MPSSSRPITSNSTSELLILKFSLEFLRLGHFSHRSVEVVLADGITVVLDGRQATATQVSNLVLKKIKMRRRRRRRRDGRKGEDKTLQQGKDSRFCDDVSQIRSVEAITHLDNALEIDIPIQNNARRVDLENLQPSDLVGQGNLNLAV